MQNIDEEAENTFDKAALARRSTTRTARLGTNENAYSIEITDVSASQSQAKKDVSSAKNHILLCNTDSLEGQVQLG